MALGVDGVRSRMAELQSRLDSLSPRPPQPEPVSSSFSPATSSFAETLEAAQNPLSGPIGGIGSGSIRPMGINGLDIQPTKSQAQLREMTRDMATQHNVSPDLFEALVEQESNFDPDARSSAGAIGLSQLMPGTASALGVKDPTDPLQNLDGGARYLADMMRKFNNDPRLALAAYNAGPGAVTRYGGVPPYNETRNYVNKILAKVARTQ